MVNRYYDNEARFTKQQYIQLLKEFRSRKRGKSTGNVGLPVGLGVGDPLDELNNKWDNTKCNLDFDNWIEVG